MSSKRHLERPPKPDNQLIQQLDTVAMVKIWVKPIPSSKDSHGSIVVFTMLYGEKKDTLYLTSTCPVDTSLTLMQSAFTYQNIYKQATTFTLSDPNSHIHLLLQALDLMKQKKWIEAKFLWIKNLPSCIKLAKTNRIDLFRGLSEWFFEQFFHDSLDQNLLVIRSKIISICDSSYCPKKALHSANLYDIILTKTQAPMLQESNYFKPCLKNWQKPYIAPCGAEFKTIDKKGSVNISENAFKINKYTLAETGNVKLSISITNEGTYLKNKDLPEEINFPSEDVNIKQSNHYIADVCFENIKNIGWYQYDELGKTYRSRAMYIESSSPPYKNNYTMDYVLYVK
ncbi:11449_t:CDS:2, partial [Gigaspora margarita]